MRKFDSISNADQVLAVVGAGPKGLAVAVKAKVLREFGFPVCRVVLIEKHSVAANWSGEAGYTNGELKLGTSPEKDVVFPIETETGNPHLDDRVRSRLLEFSWTSYLIEQRKFSEWIDRGRPAPCHQLWARYLRWVAKRLSPEVTVLHGTVERVERVEQVNHAQPRWEIYLEGTGQVVQADRLMLTGPGCSRRDHVEDLSPEHRSQVFDLETFWAAVAAKTFKPRSRIAIVGAGENSASVLMTLTKLGPDLSVDIVSPRGFVTTRAENFYENQFYSQPEISGWSELHDRDRIGFIERTDIGVFSVHAMQILNDEAHHRIVPGRLTALSSRDHEILARFEYRGRRQERLYDQVILATGSDYLSSLRLMFSATTLRQIEQQIGTEITIANLMARISDDLSLSGVTPALHLPMLAGLKQGPGFANLSCLGRLADRVVLRPYLQKLELREKLKSEIAGTGAPQSTNQETEYEAVAL